MTTVKLNSFSEAYPENVKGRGLNQKYDPEILKMVGYNSKNS